jgi:hypothetical protein
MQEIEHRIVRQFVHKIASVDSKYTVVDGLLNTHSKRPFSAPALTFHKLCIIPPGGNPFSWHKRIPIANQTILGSTLIRAFRIITL